MATPRIVKFSGGRSSGMMLMQLLEQNKLKPERGDVILFNNTSAEHPATYDFTRKIKKIAEQEYNIPFFWIEYQTYEDAGRYGYKRYDSYRLVNDQPFSDANPHGYHYKGEVFEEMISEKGYLPNMLSRICTKHLKIFITNEFLSDWFAQKDGIDRQGHYGQESEMTDNEIVLKHRFHNGSTPKDILLEKKKFVRKMPIVREASKWEDYTKASLCFNCEGGGSLLAKSVFGNRALLFGEHAVTYFSYLGIRKDEENRLAKINLRIADAKKNGSSKSSFEQPTNEKVRAPLISARVTKDKVRKYWEKQGFDLKLPANGLYSNCVYCPLKSKKKLYNIAIEENNGNKINTVETKGTPASIKWWVQIEKKYIRDLKKEKRKINKKGKKYIGFFGATNDLTYQKIMNSASSDAEYLDEDSDIPCECTD